MDTVRALWATKATVGYDVELKEVPLAALGDDEVLVEVAYSSLNYKDGLAITRKGKILRKFPLILGIDMAGKVVESASRDFKPGDLVLATGQGLGETRHGGFATAIRLPAASLVPVPSNLSLVEAMALGTAGFTAMLAVIALERAGVVPSEREVLVTGAAGGVGSVAVSLLARAGFKVAASTGRGETHEYLRRLGAQTIVGRDELARDAAPLETERWAGAIDNVGGKTLATVLAGTTWGGAVAAVGLTGGAELHTTVFPFILRNVALVGVNSVSPPRARMHEAWARLGREIDKALLAEMTTVEPLSAWKRLGEEIVAGHTRGRVVVDVRK